VRKELKLRPKRTEEPDGDLSSDVLVANGSARIQSQPAGDELTQDTALWNESSLISVEPELSTSSVASSVAVQNTTAVIRYNTV
jgi:hypothetical protein